MKNARQRTLDKNTERIAPKRDAQSAQKTTPGQAPLKEHGQPAWREVKND